MSSNNEASAVDPSLEKQDQGLAVAQGNEYVQHERIPPKSHTCCGCCCDTRRAVIVVNIISLSFAALAVFSMSMLANNLYTSQFDDDQVQAAFDEIDGTAVGISIGVVVVGMICNACGIYGAYKFHKVFIIVAALWYFADFIRAVVFLDVGGAVMTGFFLYPHVVFYQEVSKGIMSPASYPQEQQCCNCCV
eukprot:scaffold1965_cov110-Cylindrotheca_fusiformis.AAC.14